MWILMNRHKKRNKKVTDEELGKMLSSYMDHQIQKEYREFQIPLEFAQYEFKIRTTLN